MLPRAHVAALERQVAGMAEVFEAVGTPLAAAAAHSLRALNVSALLTLPPERALILLRDLVDSFRDFVETLTGEYVRQAGR